MKLSRIGITCVAVLTTRLVLTAATSMKIINGTVVGPSSPLHAMFALPTKTGDSDEWLGCGASIISPTFALTSAHCFGGGDTPCTGPKQIALWIGDIDLDRGTSQVTANAGGRSFRVKADLVCNPAFDGKCSHGNDVALLKLHKPIPNWIKPVPLDLSGTNKDKVGDIVTPMGFGLTERARRKTEVSQSSSETLRKVGVSVLAQDAANCAKMYSGGWGCSDDASSSPAQNLDMQICAGATSFPDGDACAGDSGSPVIDASGVQVGLVSYGGGPGEKMEGDGRICGDPNFPGVYGRVSAFKDFITKNVADLPAARFMSFAESEDPFRDIAPHLRR